MAAEATVRNVSRAALSAGPKQGTPGYDSSRQLILRGTPPCAHSNSFAILPPHSAEHEHGIPIRQTTPEWGSASPLGHNRSPTSPPSSRTGSSTFSHRSPASPAPLSMQLSTSSSSLSAHMLNGNPREPTVLDRSHRAHLVTRAWTKRRCTT